MLTTCILQKSTKLTDSKLHPSLDGMLACIDKLKPANDFGGLGSTFNSFNQNYVKNILKN